MGQGFCPCLNDQGYPSLGLKVMDIFMATCCCYLLFFLLRDGFCPQFVPVGDKICPLISVYPQEGTKIVKSHMYQGFTPLNPFYGNMGRKDRYRILSPTGTKGDKLKSTLIRCQIRL